MVSIASMAQVRVAIVAMLKAIGVSKFANEYWFTNKGVGIVVPSELRCDDGPISDDDEVASVKAIALERGAALRNSLPREPSAPLPGRSKWDR